MKGKILGFTPSAGTGAIAGENGERFTFVAAQWRSERPITVGTTVDFAPMAGVATEIYPVAGGAIAAPDLSELAASPAAQKARDLLRDTLAVPLALLVLLAFLLPAISSPMQSASFVGVGDLPAQMNMGTSYASELESMRAQSARLEENANQLKIYLDSAGAEAGNLSASAAMIQSIRTQNARDQMDRLAERRADLDKRIARASTAATMETLLVLRYAAPLLALFLLWRAWQGAALRIPSLATGGAAILAVILVFVLKSSLGTGIAMIDDRIQSALSLGLGAWLMAAAGIGLVLAGLGIARNPLASRA